MAAQKITLNDDLYAYLLDVSLRETPLLRRLRQETARLDNAGMQISPEQGQFLALLVRLIGARRALEVGVFTGYSSLWVAPALPPDGRLIACDINPDWTATARRYWAEAGLAHKIDLRLAPAADTLRQLLGDGEAGRFDFAFIDADKTGYPEYYELCLTLVRPGGLIVLDNMLSRGRVVDPDDQNEHVVAIRQLNRRLHTDARVDLSLVPIGDGLTLLRKREPGV